MERFLTFCKYEICTVYIGLNPMVEVLATVQGQDHIHGRLREARAQHFLNDSMKLENNLPKKGEGEAKDEAQN